MGTDAAASSVQLMLISRTMQRRSKEAASTTIKRQNDSQRVTDRGKIEKKR